MSAEAGYVGFEGRVGRTFAGSEPWWPPRPNAAGKPNVIVVLVDDLGYSDVGAYGSEIATPNIDALAAQGATFSDFHATPMCSPTRASLLTGLNPHAAGVATVAHADPGFPGYAMEIAADVATAAEIFGAAGYFTACVGKWHLSKDSDQHDGGSKHSWPIQRGFNRFYGFLDAFTNLHQPHRIISDNTPVIRDTYPADYYFTDDITDHAIEMIRSAKVARPDQPFFLYFSHGAVHAPLHAKPAAIAAQRGRYANGWDELRLQRFERQLELGVLPATATLPARNFETGHDVPAWAELNDSQRQLAARYMEIYAALVSSVDDSLGRLMAAVDELGEASNTVVVFTSDNGASREGELDGTGSYLVHLMEASELSTDLARIDEMGGPTTMPHYPRGWAMAGNTPFRLYKVNAHAGGHQVPFVISGPGIPRGQRRTAYQYVTDVLPTLLDLCELDHPPGRSRPMDGTSFVSVLNDPEAPSTHGPQYTEMVGHRGFREGCWEIVTLHQPLSVFDDREWELFNIELDPTQSRNVAAEHPEIVTRLAEQWELEAWRNQVYPLDEGSQLKYLLRPPTQTEYEKPVRIVAGTPTLERWRSLQLIFLRSCRISVELNLAAGDQGTLVAHGDQSGGYKLYLDLDRLHAVHNDGRGTLRWLSHPRPEAGEQVIELDLAMPGGGGWVPSLLIDGETVATSEERWPCLVGMAPFQGIDVGIDRASPVIWSRYLTHRADPFTGRLHAVSFKPGEPGPETPVNLIETMRSIGLRYE